MTEVAGQLQGLLSWEPQGSTVDQGAFGEEINNLYLIVLIPV
jgi:hypothetical protein